VHLAAGVTRHSPGSIPGRMNRVKAVAGRDVDQQLVGKVVIFRCFGGVIERPPQQVEQVAQGFKRIIDLIRRPHSPCYDGGASRLGCIAISRQRMSEDGAD
jgi:hypothetical protein